jgi:hypothetical protein
VRRPWQTTYKCSNGSCKIEKTLHIHLTSKCADYFKRLLESQNKQSKAFVKKVTFSEKAQEASYLVAELIAQKKESRSW